MSGPNTTRNRRIRALAAEGVSQTAIGEMFGLSETGIGRILARKGGVHLSGAARDARGAEIFARHEVGEDLATIAAALGIAEHTVEVHLREVRRDRARVVPPLVVSPVVRPARLVPTRVIGWGEFGPDVEARDAAVAAADARPFRGGRYPRSPVVTCSAMGSPALACAEFGRGMA